MSDKCDKFEALFTFSDEKTFLEHVSQCEDCKKEYEKMQKVSALIKEVKPKFKKPKLPVVQVACMLFLVVLGGVSLNAVDQQYGVLDTVKYGEQLSMADLGIPTDSYGLIQVDDEF